MSTQPAQKQRPIFSARVGSCEAAVWENQGQYGPMYAVTCHRSYREDVVARDGSITQRWQTTDSITPAQMQNMRKALDIAHSFIIQREAEDAEAKAQAKGNQQPLVDDQAQGQQYATEADIEAEVEKRLAARSNAANNGNAGNGIQRRSTTVQF